jgi:superfamily II helicase
MKSQKSTKRHCSIINCGKELREGEGKVIDGKLYCAECAIALIKEELSKAGLIL